MTRSSTTTRSLTYLIALGDVARRQALHDSCVVVGLLEAMSMVLTVKNLVIFAVVKGLAPWSLRYVLLTGRRAGTPRRTTRLPVVPGPSPPRKLQGSSAPAARRRPSASLTTRRSRAVQLSSQRLRCNEEWQTSATASDISPYSKPLTSCRSAMAVESIVEAGSGGGTTQGGCRRLWTAPTTQRCRARARVRRQLLCNGHPKSVTCSGNLSRSSQTQFLTQNPIV